MNIEVNNTHIGLVIREHHHWGLTWYKCKIPVLYFVFQIYAFWSSNFLNYLCVNIYNLMYNISLYYTVYLMCWAMSVPIKFFRNVLIYFSVKNYHVHNCCGYCNSCFRTVVYFKSLHQIYEYIYYSHNIYIITVTLSNLIHSFGQFVTG